MHQLYHAYVQYFEKCIKWHIYHISLYMNIVIVIIYIWRWLYILEYIVTLLTISISIIYMYITGKKVTKIRILSKLGA